jgi:hypothetical protein
MTKELIHQVIRFDWFDPKDRQDQIDVLMLLKILGQEVEQSVLQEVYEQWIKESV